MEGFWYLFVHSDDERDYLSTDRATRQMGFDGQLFGREDVALSKGGQIFVGWT